MVAFNYKKVNRQTKPVNLNGKFRLVFEYENGKTWNPTESTFHNEADSILCAINYGLKRFGSKLKM